MIRRFSLKVLAIAAVLPGLASCAGSATRFYTLDSSLSIGARSNGYTGPRIRVDAVHIPPALDRTELTKDLPNGQVLVSDNDHWVAPFGELARRALTQDLADRLPSGAVIFPDAPRPAAASGIVVDILIISHTGGSAVMDVSWTLVPGHPAGAAQQAPVQGSTLRLSTPTDSPGVGAIANETDKLLGQLADKITADLPR